MGQVWDQDALGSTPVGILRRAFKDVTQTRNDRSAPPPPQWYDTPGPIHNMMR